MASIRATARRSRSKNRLCVGSRQTAHDVLVFQSAFDANLVGLVIDFFRQRLRAGQAEHIVGAVLLAPCHRLGPSVMSIAPEGDARLGPAFADMSDQAAQMGAHFDAAGRLARSQHDRDGAASLGVVDMIGRKQRSSQCALNSESC